MSTLTVASANTHYGRMMGEPGGFAGIQHADVFLLQETHHTSEQARRNLSKAGFVIAHEAPDMGLTIAVNQDSGFQPVDGSVRVSTFTAPSLIAGLLRERLGEGLADRFRPRGMIALKLSNKGVACGPHKEVTVATTHPVVPVRFRARGAQVHAMGHALADDYFAGPLVVGGDMNHYPSPRRTDRKMAQTAGLSRVSLGQEPTWRIVGSNSERLGRALAYMLHMETVTDFDAQLDAVLYRGGLELRTSSVEDIASDHRAIVAEFEVTATEGR